MIKNSFDIKYWVSPLCITGATCRAPKRRVNWWKRSMKVVSVKTLFFPCETNFAHCLLTVLHSLFCMKGRHLHPYHPRWKAPLRRDEKDFNSIRNAAKKPWTCLHNWINVSQIKFFIKFEKRHDNIQFDVKSKWLKLQNCDDARSYIHVFLIDWFETLAGPI